MVGAAQLSRYTNVPMQQSIGLLSVAVRCWLVPGGPKVEIMLLRFDSGEHAAGLLSSGQAAGSEAEPIPGVPVGRTFTVPTRSPQICAMGSRAQTVFILTADAASLDRPAAESIAEQQYEKL
jgi:hypothetical protein